MSGVYKTKDIALEVKDMQMSKGLVTMYVSAFDNIDSHGDVLVKGAYSKTIQENKKRIKHLFQHDITNIIGRPVEMVEDNTGLLVTSYISDLKNGDYRKMYEDELITEHSVGIIPVKESYDEKQDANIMKEVKLFEFSSVTFGANANTPVVSMKSLTKDEKQGLFSKLEKLMKALRKGAYTDDTFSLIEIEFERIKSLIIDSEPQQKSTPELDEPIDFDIVNYFKSLNS